MHLAVEIGQVVVACPFFDFFRASVRSSVAVPIASIALLEEPLVFAFQFAVEFHAEDTSLALLKALSGFQVRAIDLGIVGALARLVCA
jgi:hypothetical protein